MNIETLASRRSAILNTMEMGSIAVVLSGNLVPRTADQFHEFAIWRNFFYLTNIDRYNMALVLVKSDVGSRAYLFIDEVTELEEKWEGFRMKKPEASALTGIKEADIFSMKDLTKTLGGWIVNENIEHAYFDLERITYNHPDSEQVLFSKELVSKYPYLKINNLFRTLANLRQIKSTEEVAHMRRAIAHTRTGIEAMMKASKPGMFEYEIEAYYDFEAKRAGVHEKGFGTIAASGFNATVLHYRDNNTQTKDGDLILFDLGCAWNHYSADITRTFPVNGKFTTRQKEVYEAVLDVEKTVIESIKSGVKMSELNKIARDMLTVKCRELGLIGDNDEDVLKYYYHSIGHPLGLDVHDVGGREFVLEAGMIITIEPGLYIAEESIGIRIEDDILVTEDGYENLSADIIKEVADIEGFMK